jgi:hypothetical protein
MRLQRSSPHFLYLNTNLLWDLLFSSNTDIIPHKLCVFLFKIAERDVGEHIHNNLLKSGRSLGNVLQKLKKLGVNELSRRHYGLRNVGTTHPHLAAISSKTSLIHPPAEAFEFIFWKKNSIYFGLLVHFKFYSFFENLKNWLKNSPKYTRIKFLLHIFFHKFLWNVT